MTIPFLFVEPIANAQALGQPIYGIMYPGIFENIDTDVIKTDPDNSIAFL